MRKNVKLIVSSVLLLLILSTCDITGGGGGGGETEQFNLSVTINPINSGSVTPNNSDYDSGTEVVLTATSEDGWIFVNWSGAISSIDNPLRITMNSDKDITATFLRIAEVFALDIPISDGEHSQIVTLVSDDDDVEEGHDPEDLESPPIAPPGAFFVGSVMNNMNLYKDARPAASRIVWEIRLNRKNGRSITLDEWSLSKDLEGTLMLVDDPDDTTPNVEINMETRTTYTVSDPSIQTIYVVYSAPEPAKMLAGEVGFGGVEMTPDFDEERITDDSQNRGLEIIRRK